MRDAIGFMWADEEDIQALRNRPGLNGGQNRAEELREELQKCIFHTDKENEIWIKNWNGEMERWKRERDEVLERIKELKSRIFVQQEEEKEKKLNDALNKLNQILENRPRDYKWISERVGEFWKFTRKYMNVEFKHYNQNGKLGIIHDNMYNFTFFVFPQFEGIFFNKSFIEEMDLYLDAAFSKAIFTHDAYFSGSIFRRNVYFSEAIFIQDAYFSEAVFIQSINFGETIFIQDASFIGTKFIEKAYFYSVIFIQGAHFSEAVFTQNTNFQGAIFEQDTYFWGAKFMQYTIFSGVKFNQNVSFSMAIFMQDSIFVGTTFAQYAYFWGTIFMKDTNFNLAIFGKSVLFKDINKYISKKENDRKLFYGHLILSKVEFIYKNTKIVLKNSNFKSLTLYKINHRLTPDNFLIHNLDISGPDGTINFESVYLEDLKFVNVNWGEVSIRRICPDLYRKDPRAARDIYRQIKLALDKQENYIDARKFYALELQAYGEELRREVSEGISRTKLGELIEQVSNFLSEKLHTDAETIENTFYSHVIPYLYGLITILGFLLIPSLISVPHHLLTGFKEVIGKSVELWQAHQLNVQNLGDIPIFPVINPIISATILLVVMWLNIWIHLHLRRLTGSLSRNPLADILIYRLYGLTADFGLSWIRPLIGLFITFGVYYLLYSIDFGIHDKLGPLAILLEPYNSIASIFPLLNGLTANGHVSPFSALILYTLIAYFIYQTVLALRRRVRR